MQPAVAVLLTVAVFAAVARTQTATSETITEARVREVVSWLAADDRRGRDTGSPELEAAADWLAERFAAANLKQVKEGSWFHDYALPGVRVDSTAITLKLVRKGDDSARDDDEGKEGDKPKGGKPTRDDKPKEFVLQPGADVRLWRAADVAGGTDEECQVALAGDPVLQRLLQANSARKPIVVEVPTDHPFWTASGGVHSIVGPRRGGSRPVFLVREKVLPPNERSEQEVSWTATWTAATPEKVEVPLRNVVALLPGASKREEFVVVSAHYDHIGIGQAVEGDGIYNGADDDASGTTAVVLLAEALAKMPPPARSVLFVCFSAEEKGLRGSAAFCERPPVPIERIVANLNLEMLGRPEPGKSGQAWITGPEYSDFAAIAGPALQKGGVELVTFRMANELFRASDNWSFVRRGVVAHSLSAGSLHADYHQPNDEVDRLDIPHMTKVIQALVAVVRELADRDAPPAWSDKGQGMLERARR